MKYFLTIIALFVMSAIGLAQNDISRARAMLIMATVNEHHKPTIKNYNDLREQAIRENKPLVVWVGINDQEAQNLLPNYLHYVCDSFENANTGDILVGIPEDNKLMRYPVKTNNLVATVVSTVANSRSQPNYQQPNYQQYQGMNYQGMNYQVSGDESGACANGSCGSSSSSSRAGRVGFRRR